MGIKKKQLWRILYIVLTLGIIFLAGVLDQNLPDVINAIKSLNIWWILIATTGILLFWVLEGVIIKYLSSFLHGRISFMRCLKIGIIGQYYCALTPGASGGQPMQVMYLAREGVKVGISTCMMCIKLICYLSATSTFILLGYILSGEYIYTYHNQAFWLAMICFAISVLAIAATIILFYNDKLIQNVVHWFVRVLHKLHIIKNQEKLSASADKLIADFKSSSTYFRQYKTKVAITYLLSVLQMFGYYTIVGFLYIATGMSGGSLYEVLIMQAFLYTTVSFIPTPGSAGAAEAGFYLFMAGFFPAGLMFVVMVIWRIITYYSNLIVGATMVVVDEVAVMKRNRKLNSAQKS